MTHLKPSSEGKYNYVQFVKHGVYHAIAHGGYTLCNRRIPASCWSWSKDISSHLLIVCRCCENRTSQKPKNP